MFAVFRNRLPAIRTQTILFILSLTLFTGQAESRSNSWWTAVFPRSTVDQTIIKGLAQDLATYVGISPDESFHGKVDAVRTFIHSNSIHQIDAEFYSYWHDIPTLMTMLATYAKNPEASYQPHFECSSRSAVMYWLLKAFDIRSRMIVVYPFEDVVLSHTYLEVYNPETENWEIQDPDYNVYWVFSKTNERASTEDLLTYPVEDTFVPCESPDECSYSEPIKQILNRFALASIIDIDGDYHPLLVNPSRFDLKHPFIQDEPHLMYCELFKGKCYQEIIKVEETTF